MRIEFRHHGRAIAGDLSYPRRSGRTRVPAVLLAHGYTGNRSGIFFPRFTQSLVRQGCAVLSIDFNGHGESGGGFRNFSYTRCIEDIAAAVRYLQRLPQVNAHAIAGIGHSMGGTAIMLARARGVDLHALVLIAPVGDLKSHDRHIYTPRFIRQWRRQGYIVVKRPHMPAPLHLGFRYWMDRRDIDTLAEARNVHQPVLVVHGSSDLFVPLAESRKLIERFDGPKRLAVVDRGRHGFMKPATYRTMDREVRAWLGEFLFNRSRRAIVAFVRSGDRYLILRRSWLVGHYRGAWGIVGGHLPRGADPAAHIYAELAEEVGYSKRDVRLVKRGRTVILHDAELDVTWSVTPFLFETDRRDVRLDWEHTSSRWVTVARMPFSKMYPGFRAQCRSIGIL